MKIDTQTLQVEITIAPAEGRKGGQRSRASGSKVPDPPRIPRITRLMALAIKFQDMVDRSGGPTVTSAKNGIARTIS